MSILSKLVTLAAAGAGGAESYVAVFDDQTHTTSMGLNALSATPNNGNIYFTGYVDDGTRLLWGSMTEAGEINTCRYHENNSPSANPAMRGNSIAWDASGYAYTGMYIYEPNIAPNERASFLKLTANGVPTTANWKTYYNSLGRGGGVQISVDGSGNIYLPFDAYDGSARRTYITKVASDFSSIRNDAIAHFQNTFLRSSTHNGSAVYLDITHTIDGSYGRYGHAIVSKNDSSTSLNFSYVFDRLGGATDSVGAAQSGGGLAVDGSYIYSCGYDDGNSASGYNCGHVFKLSQSTGALQWQSAFIERSGATYYQSECQKLTIDGDGNVYVSCRGSNDHDLLLKYNSSGALQWVYKIGTQSASRRMQLNSGMTFYNGFLYVGAFYNNGTENTAAIVKVSPDGLSTGTFGDFVISIPQYDQPTNYPNYYAYTPTSTTDTVSTSAWTDAYGLVSIVPTVTVI